MGFMDSIFGNNTSGQGFEKIPLTKDQKAAQSFLMAQLNKSVNIPTQQVAGLSPTEQLLQNNLSSYFGAGGGYQSGMNAINDQTKYVDPVTSPYFKGLAQQSQLAKEKGVSALRQRSQLGGMLFSSPSARAEGEYTSNLDANLMAQLGQLENQQKAQQLQAAQMAMQNPLAALNSAAPLAAQPRTLEQALMEAQYNQQLQSMLFPYQYQAPIAQGIMNNQAYAWNPGTTSPSMFSTITGGIGSILGGLYGNKGLMGFYDNGNN